MASTKLTRTNGAGTNIKKWTWSAWVKRGTTGSQETLVRTRYNDNNYARIRFDSDDTLTFEDRYSSTTHTNLISNAKYRDLSAWYHVLVRVDYTQATEADRARIYVNGSEISYSTSTRGAQNINSYFNDATSHDIGHYNSNNYFAGSMTHVHLTDGYSYAPSTFGETDSTSGIWKPKTSPSVTYGNNGYFLKMENSSDFGEDSSGNNNDFTTSGTITQTEDTPSNNFATLNPLHKGTMLTGFTFANGNNTFTAGSTNFPFTCSTIAASSGKYYAEFKTTANANQIGIGISAGVASPYIGHNQYDYAYYGNNGNIITNQTQGTTYGTGLSTNDILGVAMDLDNNKLYFSVNGSWQNSANPSSGTGGLSITAPSSTTTGVYHFALGDEASSTPSVQCNFGNGYFGTTAISSEGTNASGIGKFEYDVPTGFTALSTKGLNE